MTGGHAGSMRSGLAPHAKRLLLGSGFYSVFRRVLPSRRLAILRYHAVCARDGEYAEPEICVTPAAFERHAAYLAANYRVLPLPEAVAALRRGLTLPRNAACLTFDDGYADNLEAARTLARYNLTATFYLTAGCLADGAPFWPAELRALIAAVDAPSIRLDAEGVSLDLPLGGPAERRAAVRRLTKTFKAHPIPVRDALREALRRAAGREPSPSPMLTWADVREMHRLGMEIGSHTLTHPNLPNAGPADAEREIVESKARLESELGVPVTMFSYPNGGAERYMTPSVARLVELAGYAAATTSRNAFAGPESDPFALERIQVSEDLEALVFALEVERFAFKPAPRPFEESSSGTAGRAMVVTTNFPPDASVGTMRTLRLVRHLARTGWQVDVVTMSPETFRAGTVTDPASLDNVPEGVHVLRVRAWRPIERLGAALRSARGNGPTPLPSRPGIAARNREPRSLASRWLSQVKGAAAAGLSIPDREVSWLVPAVHAGWRRTRSARPQVIYSSGPPFTAHVVAAALARLARVPWVADFRDPWARAPWRHDRFAFERRAWSILERRIVTRADAVVFVSEMNRAEFAQHYGGACAARFHVVANGCEVSDFDGLERRRPASAGAFVLLHAGSLYGARNPAALLEALHRAIARGAVDRMRFRLRFIGRIGIPDVNLPQMARDLALGDVVEFIEHMPRRAALQQMLDASALLIVQPVTTVSVPAKFYEYMAAGRPVLALAEPDGETAALVHQCGAGLVVSPEDRDGIEQALGSLVGLEERFVPVDRSCYDGARRAGEIAEVLGAVASGSRRGFDSARLAGSAAPEVAR